MFKSPHPSGKSHITKTDPIASGKRVAGAIAHISLLTLYQQLHDTVHARSGQTAPLRLVYMKTEHEAVLAWVSEDALLLVDWLNKRSQSRSKSTSPLVRR